MKKFKMLFGAIFLSIVLLFQACIGSFKLTHSVYDWNMNVGDKFVNELVFLVCNIVPVYSVAVFVDSVVLNSIEFWTNDNPMGMKDGEKHQKTVEIDGKKYRLTSEKYKMTIEDLSGKDASTEFVFNEEDSSWYLKKGKKFQKLVEVVQNDEGKITSYNMYFPDGTSMEVQSGFDPVAVKTQISYGQTMALQE
ncbi:DUF3332 domain-containing protein [Sunxiuqinia sp. A32]|uniref:DUF3332 domain-containing protein n=1 Tax=Sunxiuqinia sp. A32 TaxID=3461496 RepID=UPI004045E8D2